MKLFKTKEEKELKKEFKKDLEGTKFNYKTINELTNGKGDDDE